MIDAHEIRHSIQHRTRRKTRPALALALALTLTWTVTQQAHAETLNFSQCIQIALKQNPDMMESQARVHEAEAGLKQATGSRVPKLTASINAVGTNDALTAFGLKLSERQANFNDFGAGQFNPSNPNVLSVQPNNLNYPGFVHNIDTRLEIDAPIYTGGMIDGGIKQAHAYVAAAQRGDRSARQHLIFNVLQAYEGVHAARAFVQVAKQAETAAQSQLTMMTNMKKGGAIVKSDLLLAQVQLQDIQIQRAQAENALQSALDQLHVLLGIPLDQALDVGEEVNIPADHTALAVLRQQAIDHNPGIQALRQQVEAESANVDIARAGEKPQIGLMLREDWNDAQVGFGANSYTIGGTISWTAFDGGVTHGKIDQAQAGRNQVVARLSQAQANIAYQIGVAQRKAIEAEQRLAERQLALSQMEEATRLVNKRYANGVATITEELDAEAQLDKARADLVNAHYDLIIQRASLELALGQLDTGLF